MTDTNERRCPGCGAILQSDSPDKDGYVPASSLKKEGRVICQRCFKLVHYHQMTRANATSDDYLNLLDTIADDDALVVYVLDLFDFNAGLIPGLSRHIGGNDILVLANKRDILPKSLKDHKIEMWVRRQLKEDGLKVKDVILTSGKKNYQFDEIMDTIERLRRGRNVYVVGVTNVGKSTLINGLLRSAAGVTGGLSVSEFPGTTLGLIRLGLADGTALYDTPGIVNEHQMTSRVPEDELVYCLPQGELRPQTFQLQSGQTLWLGGLARVDITCDDKVSVTTCFARKLNIHRTKTVNADGLYDRHQTLQPCLESVAETRDFKHYEFTINDKTRDLCVAGLGFVTVRGACRVSVYAPDGVDVITREALI